MPSEGHVGLSNEKREERTVGTFKVERPQDHTNTFLRRKAAFLDTVDWMEGKTDLDLDSICSTKDALIANR
jgi:hypothetical protein